MPTHSSQRGRLGRGGIRIADLVICYPQRSLAPPSALSAGDIPRSYGILPIAEITRDSAGVFGDAIIGAVSKGEIVWLGFGAATAGRSTLVRVRVEGPEPLDALTGKLWTDRSPACLSCPPDFALSGILHGQVCEPFGGAEAGSAGVVQRLTILARAAATERVEKISWRNAAAAQLLLVRPNIFADHSGLSAEPLDPDSAYKDWRLP